MRVRLEYLSGIGICESQVKRVGVGRAGCVAEILFFRILPCPESVATSDGGWGCRIAFHDENIRVWPSFVASAEICSPPGLRAEKTVGEYAHATGCFVSTCRKCRTVYYEEPTHDREGRLKQHE